MIIYQIKIQTFSLIFSTCLTNIFLMIHIFTMAEKTTYYNMLCI